jgi:hypothetical protein
MRILYTFRIIREGSEADVSFDIAWMGLWSYVELAIGITVACLLSLPKLAQVRGWKLPPTISRFYKRVTSIKTPSFSTWYSSSEAKEPDVLIEQANDAGARQTTPEEDIAFETGSYHLYPLSSESSRV